MCVGGTLGEMADSQPDPKKDIAALQKAIRDPLKKSKKFDDKSKKDLDKAVKEITLGVIAVLVAMKPDDGTKKRLDAMNKALTDKPKKRCVWCWILFSIAFFLLVVGIIYMFFWLDLICFEDWSIAIGCPEPTSASP